VAVGRDEASQPPKMVAARERERERERLSEKEWLE
jgi:hypothetical protein